MDETKDNGWGPLSALPGNPLIWVLILGELFVFTALFAFYGGARAAEPQIFQASQRMLDPLAGGINTMVLLTSGLFAALAIEALARDEVSLCRRWLTSAIGLGSVFCAVKIWEYWDKISQGLMPDTNTFFTYYYMLTGFHFIHVVVGLVLLALVLRFTSMENVETAAAFWHMVDLIWIFLYPLLYLLR
ncbi:nitric oxide reductase NorE protein [Halospina denitrificans]|uniref:Nitric oxide reductase NorE protein n=1 Tax=Halospina denitrificans TaxID=332522 RepID=A0A4R7JWA9_9GAMM|nr:cytochrome c oxidase subunit 3 family protein [Halospina denitrificans]TDT41733.1 nitric oxide reductase NorE protein [Halospina denitrificans]